MADGMTIPRRRQRPLPIGDRIVRLALAGAALGGLMGVPSAFSLLASPGARDGVAAITPPSEVEDSPIVDGDDTGRDVGHKGIARAGDGMFYAEVTINGARMRCLVDTGASDMVLDAADRRLGLGREPAFDGSILTAGGARPAARTRIESVALAGRSFHRVPAVLVRGAATPCLLGQEMLARLDAVELHGDRLVMR